MWLLLGLYLHITNRSNTLVLKYIQILFRSAMSESVKLASFLLLFFSPGVLSSYEELLSMGNEPCSLIFYRLIAILRK